MNAGLPKILVGAIPVRDAVALGCFLLASMCTAMEDNVLAQDATVPIVATPLAKPPSDAIVLFDGNSTDGLLNVDGSPCSWPVEDGVLKVGQGFVVSKFHFRDAQIHAEFTVPPEANGNSGLYIHGQYEMQISNTGGTSAATRETIGSLYRFHAPMVNAGRPSGEWQTYDLVFRAPRYKDGKIESDGGITALLNGVVVQHNTSFRDPRSPYTPYVYKQTPYTLRILDSLKKTGAGPLFLQDHQSPVRFRSIWVRPLDDQSFRFEGQESAGARAK
jgi:hypothetical protein